MRLLKGIPAIDRKNILDCLLKGEGLNQGAGEMPARLMPVIGRDEIVLSRFNEHGSFARSLKKERGQKCKGCRSILNWARGLT